MHMKSFDMCLKMVIASAACTFLQVLYVTIAHSSPSIHISTVPKTNHLRHIAVIWIHKQ